MDRKAGTIVIADGDQSERALVSAALVRQTPGIADA